MRRFLFGFAFACAACRAAGQMTDISPDPLAALVLERVQAADSPTCVAVAVIDDRARMTYACSKEAGPVVLARDSIFEIGSITKGMTGLLLADMVRKGEVSLDDAASKYAPAGARLPTRSGREITLRDLVTHTSGLPRMPPGFAPRDRSNPFGDFGVDELYKALAATTLERDIGTGYEYSNFGYIWLSDLLSRRGGKSYDALLAERVLAPLGMVDTGIALSAEQRKRLVVGHDERYRVTPEWTNVPELAGVGGLRSSLDDMVKLVEALSGKRDTPIRETIALAVAPLRPSNGRNSTGFGWVTHERPPDARVLWHNGGTGGFRSMLAINSITGKGAVVLVDSAQSFDDLVLHLVDPGAMPLRRKRVAIAIEAASRGDYVGRYELSPSFTLTVSIEGDRLLVQGTGQPAMELLGEARDRFFSRGVDATLVFRRGADGKVEGLTLQQGGRDMPGTRMP
jgi:serine-type D-Ala-D-Ala carboxypeptidase/endopeptidase